MASETADTAESNAIARDSIAETQVANDVQATNDVQVANEAQTGRRRERRTRRPQIGSENTGNAVIMAQNGDETVKAESQEANVERQTAKVERQTAKVDNQTANVESQSKPEIDDKTAPKAQKSPKAERPRRDAISEPVVVAEAPQNGDNRSKRRVRKVNAARIDTALYAKDDVAAVNADLASADSSAVSADLGSVSADSSVSERDAVEVVAPVERQPRQPRRSRSRIEAKDKASDDLGVERKVDEPKVDAVADIADKVREADKANDKVTKSTRRTRTVRARMASTTAAESEGRVDVAPVAEPLPVVDNSPAVEDGGAQTEPASKPRRARQTRRARPGDDVQ